MEYYRLTIPIPKAPWRWIRFRIVTTLLLMTIVALALAWRRDHQRLTTELAALQYPGPYYEPIQATGPPNANSSGDSSSAWCPATANGGVEWLILEYEKPLVPKAIVLHENIEPGAVVRVTHYPTFGREQTLWEGAYTPTEGANNMVATLPVTTATKTQRIKVYLDTAAGPDWNEIDAVGMVDGAGQVSWAVGASASSAWGAGMPQSKAVNGITYTY
jgi:hypothetical protein